MQPFGCIHTNKSQDNRHADVYMLMHMLLQRLALAITMDRNCFMEANRNILFSSALAKDGAKLMWTQPAKASVGM